MAFLDLQDRTGSIAGVEHSFHEFSIGRTRRVLEPWHKVDETEFAEAVNKVLAI